MIRKIKKLLALLILIATLLCNLSLFFSSAEEQISYSLGNIIQFGTYPQEKVIDENIITELNALAPEWDNWTSYDYYCLGEQGDWMRYTDITYNNQKYRGVKFTQYRPRTTYSSHNDSDISYTGFELNTTYWYLFTPIDWIVLDPKTGLVFSKYILDSQPFRNLYHATRYGYYTDTTCTSYASRYEVSDIRQWLNRNFFNTAFDNNEKKYIPFVTIDDNISQEKVFLLSIEDATNPSYGFPTDYWGSGGYNFRSGYSTSYASSQGASSDRWILRSPSTENYTRKIFGVESNGNCYPKSYDAAIICCRGIRPALYLKLVADAYNCPHKTIVAYEKTSETCTEEGYSAGTFCIDCNEWISGHEIIVASGHNYIETIKKVTCTENGCNIYTCSKCSDSYVTNIIEASGHNYIENIVQPTCTLSGYTLYSCSNCSNTYSANFKGATGHSFTNYISNNNASCTKNGTKTARCDNNCGLTDTVTDYGSAKGHSFTNYVSNENATCTKNGTKTARCDNNCGLTDTVTDYGSAKGHSFTNFVSNGDATCYNDGTKTAWCDNGCGSSQTVKDEGSAIGHIFDSNDENCQLCGFDRTADCSCNCHKGGIQVFFFNIILFFQKLFRMNGVCACGVAHY